MASWSWSGWKWGGAGAETVGTQSSVPATALVEDTANIGPDGALQLSAVWACIERRATTIASLPFFVYQTDSKGMRTLARQDRLYVLLHDSPNSRMTPMEFWRAMVMNHDLRGNAYARIDRDQKGEAIAMWPMPADQVDTIVLPDGSIVYKYTLDNNVAILSSENVLHLKNLGNGTTGFSKLEFMRATVDENAKAQTSASKLFGNGGKPTGVLMVDKTLTEPQRKQIKDSFAGLAIGSTSRLAVLEASMKYQQISMSAEDQQLLETRKFGVEEVCRWFDVPPILVHHSGTTTWGTGIEQIVNGFHTLTIRPMLVNIEQALRKRVMTSKQRAMFTAEFNHDALLRGNITARFDVYAKAVQNGLKTRNECRQLENDPPMADGNVLTAQTNLAPLNKLGQVAGGSNADSQSTVAQ